MDLSGIEFCYLVGEIKKRVSGYYVSNVYGITRDSIILKLHHPREAEIMLAISGRGIWITRYRFEGIEDNTLVSPLRKEILRARVHDLLQSGSERIVQVKFGRDSVERYLVAEFFAGGNMLLCDESMKILALLKRLETRHRTLAVKARYQPPPRRALDVLELRPEHMKAMLSSSLTVASWMGRKIALARKFIEEALSRSEIEPGAKCSDLTEGDANRLYRSVTDLVSDVCSGNHAPVLVMRDETIAAVAMDASPVPLQASAGRTKQIDSYMEAVDLVLSSNIKSVVESARTYELTRRIKELEQALEQQERAKRTLVERSRSMRDLANSLVALAGEGVSSIDDPSVKTLLSGVHAELFEEKDSMVIGIGDEKVRFDRGSGIRSVASLLYSRAKELEHGIESIGTARTRIVKELERLKHRSEHARKAVTPRRQVSKEWFERYRWFVTTDGLLAVGGRDASSNQALVRKYLGEGDLVFHAEVHGSPFFILKNASPDREQSISEVAQATASFSRAWREGLFAADAYWVRAGQVRKAAPSGQYLARGAFMIRGKRSYIKGLELRLAVGLVTMKSRPALMCGPPNSVKRNSIVYVAIAPDGGDASSVAKQIKTEFIKKSTGKISDFARELSIDEIIRAIPSGRSRVLHCKRGESKGALYTQQND